VFKCSGAQVLMLFDTIYHYAMFLICFAWTHKHLDPEHVLHTFSGKQYL